AEAMHLTEAVAKLPAGATPRFLIAEGCHPQTIAVVRTRAEARAVQTVIADPMTFEFRPGVIGALLQYPLTDGKIEDYRAVCERAHAAGALVTVATDLLALTLLKPPGEWGADIAVGNSQRFGVPMGYGGPHAAFFATREEHKRHVPGRIIGVSRDAAGRPALPMAPTRPARAASTCAPSRRPASACRSTKPPRSATWPTWSPHSRSTRSCRSWWKTSAARPTPPYPTACGAARPTSRTRSSTATAPRRRCCGTSSGSRPATCRSPPP